jgi:hypothetical protein
LKNRRVTSLASTPLCNIAGGEEQALRAAQDARLRTSLTRQYSVPYLLTATYFVLRSKGRWTNRAEGDRPTEADREKGIRLGRASQNQHNHEGDPSAHGLTFLQEHWGLSDEGVGTDRAQGSGLLVYLTRTREITTSRTW